MHKSTFYMGPNSIYTLKFENRNVLHIADEMSKLMYAHCPEAIDFFIMLLSSVYQQFFLLTASMIVLAQNHYDI